MNFRKTMRIPLVALGAFVAGWLASGILDDGSGASRTRIITPALAQVSSTRLDPNFMALALGVASVAVDSEATAQRLNELADRVATLERRLQTLEKAGNR